MVWIIAGEVSTFPYIYLLKIKNQKIMYRKNNTQKSSFEVNKSYSGETIEEKVDRIVNNKEPIKDGAPIIYTDRRDGVKPEFDIRTDRFELAVDSMDKVAQSYLAKRMDGIGERAKEGMKAEGLEPGGQSIPATGQGESQ